MGIPERLQGVKRIFLDTAPVIYYVERHPEYAALVTPVFDMIDEGGLLAVTSPITLAECLVGPCRNLQQTLRDAFRQRIIGANNTVFVGPDASMAQQAAELRATYRLSLLDCLQIAIALGSGCDAFLTNDLALTCVKEANVIALCEAKAG